MPNHRDPDPLARFAALVRTAELLAALPRSGRVLLTMLLTAVLIPASEGGFTALNPETGSTSQGKTVKQALANLKEATELYLEEFPLMATGQPLVTTIQVGVDA